MTQGQACDELNTSNLSLFQVPQSGSDARIDSNSGDIVVKPIS
jgi:uncharacterized protein YqkB